VSASKVENREYEINGQEPADDEPALCAKVAM
jgi:hypothetical protein